MPDAKQPVLTNLEVARYFDRIHLPPQHRIYDVSHMDPVTQLSHLAEIQKYHLVYVPFENLTLHYSSHHQISLDIEDLFKKVVENARGGYCMENNTMFGTLLRSIGYRLYSAGARVNEGEDYNGWSHMINIVIIGSKRYHVDVGFGPNGPTRPLEISHEPSVHGQTHVQIAPATMRLVYKNIADNTDPDQRLWVYQHRIGDDADFQDTYCFTELEFLPQDYAVMNYFTSTSSKTWFTSKVICARMIFEEAEDGGALAGALIAQENLKKRLNGVTEVVEEFKTEDDRVNALEKHFGIKMTSAERNGIRGMTTEIKAEGS